MHIRSRGPRRSSRGSSYLQDGGGKLWAEPIPRSLLPPQYTKTACIGDPGYSRARFPFPTLRFRNGSLSERALVTLARNDTWKGIGSLYRNIKSSTAAVRKTENRLMINGVCWSRAYSFFSALGHVSSADHSCEQLAEAG